MASLASHLTAQLDEIRREHGPGIAAQQVVEAVPRRSGCRPASWMAALAEGIAASGTPQDLATDLASYVLAALEGAIILSRTSRSVRPLEQTAQFVLHTLDAKLLRKARNARQGVKS